LSHTDTGSFCADLGVETQRQAVDKIMNIGHTRTRMQQSNPYQFFSATTAMFLQWYQKKIKLSCITNTAMAAPYAMT